MIHNELPEGWAETTLNEVAKINPLKPSLDSLSNRAEITFVPMPAIDADSGTILKPEIRTFASVKKGFTSFKNDDVIFAKITPCMENGKAAIARDLKNGVGFGSTEFHVLRSSCAILPAYIYRFIRQESFRKEAKSEMTGSVGQKRVPTDFLKNAHIPLPPLDEQKRIVSKIEELLLHASSAKENLASAKILLKRFRQSVLTAACSGRLTEDWREKIPNLPNVSLDLKIAPKEVGEICPEITTSVVDFELPENWVMARVCEFAGKVGSGATPRGGSRAYKQSGIPLIRSQNIHFDGFKKEGLAFINDSQAMALKEVTVRTGDVLLNITGASIGRVTQAPPRMNGARVNQHVCIIRPMTPVNALFLNYFFASPYMQDIIMLQEYGVTRQALTKAKILSLEIPIPPSREQQEIVSRIKALFALADSIEKRVRLATAYAENITQAILAKAFRGELVPTEAELARQEGRDYEAATVLLKRVKREREKNRDQVQPPKGKAKQIRKTR